MNKFCILSICLLSVLGLKAQEFQGKADYFSKLIFKNGVEDLGIKSDDNLRKDYEEAFKKATEKIYTLTFNKKEALYEKKEVLEKPTHQNGVSVSFVLSGEGKKYINIQDQIKIIEDDIFGKEFLIVEKLNPLEWKLIDETKKIGEYTCNKAELIIPVSEKEKKEYEEYLKKQEIKPSFFPMDEPKDKKITAWFTPEIPISVGPLNYWGLPGLILEINDGKMIILCSKITLSNKENTKIKVPNVGKQVSQEEFDAIHKDKRQSLEER